MAGVILRPALVFVHEAGACVRGLSAPAHVTELRVGDQERIFTVSTGPFRLRLSGVSDTADVAGYVMHDGGLAGPLPVLVIALAGPFASLAGAVATDAAS